MKSIPFRMQRIIKYKFFERLPWEEVARKIGDKMFGRRDSKWNSIDSMEKNR